jgi:hypothetical protein
VSRVSEWAGGVGRDEAGLERGKRKVVEGLSNEAFSSREDGRSGGLLTVKEERRNSLLEGDGASDIAAIVASW